MKIHYIQSRCYKSFKIIKLTLSKFVLHVKIHFPFDGLYGQKWTSFFQFGSLAIRFGLMLIHWYAPTDSMMCVESPCYLKKYMLIIIYKWQFVLNHFIPFYLMINIFSTFPTFSARLSLIWPCRTCDSKLSTGEIAWQPNVSSQGNNQKMYPIRNVFIITTVLGDRVIWKCNINDIVQYLVVLKVLRISFFSDIGKKYLLIWSD